MSLCAAWVSFCWTIVVLMTRWAAGAAPASGGQDPLTAAGLTCEYRHADQAVDIDVDHPRLAWTLRCGRRGAAQSAYRVLVASTPARLAADTGDLWDSGRVVSAETIGVAYAGRPLESLQRCFWKVQVWDGASTASGWSDASTWTMGLLAAADWHAQWITLAPPTTAPAARSAPIFRKQLRLDRPVDHATISICGLGQSELHVNGHRVGNDVLEPGWTDYAKTDLYVTHDVTELLRPGENAVGVMLGGGQLIGGDLERGPTAMS